MARIWPRVPKDIWIVIFKWLLPREEFTGYNHSLYNRAADDLYNCRLVCKRWAEVILVTYALWHPFVKNLSHVEGLWMLLSEGKWSLYYAQITMGGFTEKDATLAWLARCYRKKRWDLMFQILSPILVAPIYHVRRKSTPFLFDSSVTLGMETVKWRCQEYWARNHYAHHNFYGEFFAVIGRDRRTESDPSHIVFCCDSLCGPRLTLRTWWSGFNLNCHSDREISEDFIWYGVRCMWELWRCYHQFNYCKDVHEEIQNIFFYSHLKELPK